MLAALLARARVCVCGCIYANMFVDTPPHTHTMLGAASIATRGQPTTATFADDGELIEPQRGVEHAISTTCREGAGLLRAPRIWAEEVPQGTVALINQAD